MAIISADSDINKIRETLDLMSETNRLNAQAGLARARRKEERRHRVESLNPVGRFFGRAWLELIDAPAGAAMLIFLAGMGCCIAIAIAAAVLR